MLWRLWPLVCLLLADVEAARANLPRPRLMAPDTWQGPWVQTNETRFIFDRNLAIQERDANTAVLASYTRGIDFSGTRQGDGGIGGLLAFTQNATANHSFYHCDGNGNITALINAQQSLVATYEYGPFGHLFAWSGS